MDPLSGTTVTVTALALAGISSLVAQLASARVLQLLRVRHASVYEEILSSPDSWRLNRRTVSPARVLRIVRQQSFSMHEDRDLQRAVGVLHISHRGVTVFFVVCAVSVLLHVFRKLP